jgi:UDP-N-acetylglucosamine/UDP-N-acetylgalactosamine 4-epimerase
MNGNVFGKKQDPETEYAAVIPKRMAAMIADGAVQAHLLAASTTAPAACNRVYNVTVCGRTSLNQLFAKTREALAGNGIRYEMKRVYRDFRAGDMPHSRGE